MEKAFDAVIGAENPVTNITCELPAFRAGFADGEGRAADLARRSGIRDVAAIIQGFVNLGRFMDRAFFVDAVDGNDPLDFAGFGDAPSYPFYGRSDFIWVVLTQSSPSFAAHVAHGLGRKLHSTRPLRWQAWPNLRQRLHGK